MIGSRAVGSLVPPQRWGWPSEVSAVDSPWGNRCGASAGSVVAQCLRRHRMRAAQGTVVSHNAAVCMHRKGAALLFFFLHFSNCWGKFTVDSPSLSRVTLFFCFQGCLWWLPWITRATCLTRATRWYERRVILFGSQLGGKTVPVVIGCAVSSCGGWLWFLE